MEHDQHEEVHGVCGKECGLHVAIFPLVPHNYFVMMLATNLVSLEKKLVSALPISTRMMYSIVSTWCFQID